MFPSPCRPHPAHTHGHARQLSRAAHRRTAAARQKLRHASASPTACLPHAHGYAATFFDRHDKSVPMVQGTWRSEAWRRVAWRSEAWRRVAWRSEAWRRMGTWPCSRMGRVVSEDTVTSRWSCTYSRSQRSSSRTRSMHTFLPTPWLCSC